LLMDSSGILTLSDWDGHLLILTPAYDICPQGRHGHTATQAMLITGNDRSSRIATCIDAAPQFLLSKEKAIQIIEKQISGIEQNWSIVCDEASLSEVDRNMLWGNQIVNPYIFEGLESGPLKDLAKRHKRR